MAMAYQLQFKGTLDQYDRVVKKMGFKPRGVAAERAYFHWVTKTKDGFMVVDVWENAADFDKFAKEKIGPLSAAEGLAPPTVTAYEVHNYLIGGLIK